VDPEAERQAEAELDFLARAIAESSKLRTGPGKYQVFLDTEEVYAFDTVAGQLYLLCQKSWGRGSNAGWVRCGEPLADQLAEQSDPEAAQLSIQFTDGEAFDVGENGEISER
tara:strand:+ start:207 stop:542 length:336 start_codon:yes stop_codon:yes gene_type:complete